MTIFFSFVYVAYGEASNFSRGDVLSHNELLSSLGDALEQIYNHRVIKNAKNRSKLEQEHKKLVTELRQLSIQLDEDYDRDKYEDGVDKYHSKILELLRFTGTQVFFAKNAVKDSVNNCVNINKSLLILATVALLTDAALVDCDFYQLAVDLLARPIIMPLSNKKVVLGLVEGKGAYNVTYQFFVLSLETGHMEVKPYNLPQPKTFYLRTLEGNILNRGLFLVEKNGENYHLSYSESLSSFETAHSIIWEISEKQVRIIEEIEETEEQRIRNEEIRKIREEQSQEKQEEQTLNGKLKIPSENPCYMH